MPEDLSALDTFSPEEQAYFENQGSDSTAPTPTIAEDVPQGGDARSEAVDESGAPELAPELDAPEQKAEKPRTVPHAALHEERQRRKELELQLRQTNSRFEQLLARLEPKAPEQPAVPAVEAPDPDVDPVGAIKFATEQARQAKVDREQRDAAERQQAETHQFVERYQRDAGEWAKETPDFMEAYNHLKDSRRDELVAMGYQPDQAARQLIQEEIQIANLAYQAGRNPAEVLYDIAHKRGYAKKAAAPARSGPTAEEKLAAVEAGMNASKSLSGTGGRANTEAVQVADLMKMSDEDFGKWMDKNPAKARRLFGA